MKLTPQQMDALCEMVNIGIGQAAGVLNAMVSSHVELHAPVIDILSGDEIQERIHNIRQDSFAAVRLGFRGPFSGNASLIIPPTSAAKLVMMLTEDNNPSPDLDAIRIGALTEIGNIVLNGVMGAIGNELKLQIFYSVPSYLEHPIDILAGTQPIIQDLSVIWVETTFTIVKQQITGEIIILFEVGSLNLLLAAIERKVGA